MESERKLTYAEKDKKQERTRRNRQTGKTKIDPMKKVCKNTNNCGKKKIKITGGKKHGKKKMTEGKKNVIAKLLQEYDINTAADLEDALKDLMGGTIESMLESELDNHLG